MFKKLKKNSIVVGVYVSLRNIMKRIKHSFDYIKFKKKLTDNRGFELKWKDRSLSIADDTISTSFDTHYIYHPGWAARIVAQTKPNIHTDISSTLNFCSILSAFQKVEFYDYRPANLILDNLKTGQADLCKLFFQDNSIPSLSCMHTIEHIGLGRYGDPIDPNGDMKASSELSRVLKNEGNLLIVVPVGKPKIVFNSHRIYSFDQVISLFRNLKLKEFSLIPDNALETGIIKNATKETVGNQNYACGCFWFTK